MRPGGRAKGQPDAGLVAQRRRKSVVAADDENRGRAAIVAPAAEAAGQCRAVEVFAAFVEDDDDRSVGYQIRERDRFLDHALADLLRAALADLDHFGVAEAD